MAKFKNITDLKYGKLTVKWREPYNIRGYAVWVCECECGRKTSLRGDSIRSENTKSCGKCSRAKTSSLQP